VNDFPWWKEKNLSKFLLAISREDLGLHHETAGELETDDAVDWAMEISFPVTFNYSNKLDDNSLTKWLYVAEYSLKIW